MVSVDLGAGGPVTPDERLALDSLVARLSREDCKVSCGAWAPAPLQSREVAIDLGATGPATPDERLALDALSSRLADADCKVWCAKS